MLNQLTCPNCGGTLPASAAHSDVVICPYCNVSFRVSKTPTPEPDMGNLVLGADFRQMPIPGWGFPNKDMVSTSGTNPPELRFKFGQQKGVLYAINSSGYFDDIDASASIRFYEGNVDLIDAGLIVRYQRNTGSYLALITPLGTYTIGYYEYKKETDSMAWNTILNWTAHSAIKQGLNQTNRVRLITKGNQLRVYFNGVLATSIRDSRYNGGEVLLAAESSEKSSIDVGFSELQLREVKE